MTIGERRGSDLLDGLLRRTHLSAPSDLAAVVGEEARSIGAQDVTLHVIDYEQKQLVPLLGSGPGDAENLSVAGTVAGRAYSSTSILRAPSAQPGVQRLWIPLLDGTDRLGVLGLSFAEDALSDRMVALCERYAHLV